jgi:hypothetical protein
MRADPPPPWFERRIKHGLAALLTLRLDGHPPADVVEATARVWALALWPGRAWIEKGDGERIGEAFRVCALRETRWPTPAVLLRYLPPRAEPPALPRPRPDPALRAQVLAQLRHVTQRLRERSERPAVRPIRPWTSEQPDQADDPAQPKEPSDARSPD